MALSRQKKFDLYRYYLQNGFDNSVDSIAKSLNISKKTFYNRFSSKSKSIEIAINCWLDVVEERWRILKERCNNAIEELVMFLYITKHYQNQENVYYSYIIKNHLYKNNVLPFKNTLISILKLGKQKFYISETLDTDLFSEFLLNNLFLIEVELDKRNDVLQYVLHAALTERGFELLNQIDFLHE